MIKKFCYCISIFRNLSQHSLPVFPQFRFFNFPLSSPFSRRSFWHLTISAKTVPFRSFTLSLSLGSAWLPAACSPRTAKGRSATTTPRARTTSATPTPVPVDYCRRCHAACDVKCNVRVFFVGFDASCRRILCVDVVRT